MIIQAAILVIFFHGYYYYYFSFILFFILFPKRIEYACSRPIKRPICEGGFQYVQGNGWTWLCVWCVPVSQRQNQRAAEENKFIYQVNLFQYKNIFTQCLIYIFIYQGVSELTHLKQVIDILVNLHIFNIRDIKQLRTRKTCYPILYLIIIHN